MKFVGAEYCVKNFFVEKNNILLKLCRFKYGFVEKAIFLWKIKNKFTYNFVYDKYILYV